MVQLYVVVVGVGVAVAVAIVVVVVVCDQCSVAGFSACCSYEWTFSRNGHMLLCDEFGICM